MFRYPLLATVSDDGTAMVYYARIHVDSFKDNSEFEEIMGYINTSENKQIKGVKGSEK